MREPRGRWPGAAAASPETECSRASPIITSARTEISSVISARVASPNSSRRKMRMYSRRLKRASRTGSGDWCWRRRKRANCSRRSSACRAMVSPAGRAKNASRSGFCSNDCVSHGLLPSNRTVARRASGLFSTAALSSVGCCRARASSCSSAWSGSPASARVAGKRVRARSGSSSSTRTKRGVDSALAKPAEAFTLFAASVLGRASGFPRIAVTGR